MYTKKPILVVNNLCMSIKFASLLVCRFVWEHVIELVQQEDKDSLSVKESLDDLFPTDEEEQTQSKCSLDSTHTVLKMLFEPVTRLPVKFIVMCIENRWAFKYSDIFVPEQHASPT